MRTSRRPTYSLEDMKELVEKGKFRPTERVERFLISHYDVESAEIIETVFKQLKESDFIKSIELNDRPGTMADVYAGGWYDDTEWYVKAFVEGETVTLQIWSMCWDGALH